jgi:hypothetical protein
MKKLTFYLLFGARLILYTSLRCFEDLNLLQWKWYLRRAYKSFQILYAYSVENSQGVPKERSTIKLQWTFRARLVTCDYCQVLIIEISKSFVSVTNDVRFRIVFIAKLIWQIIYFCKLTVNTPRNYVEVGSNKIYLCSLLSLWVWFIMNYFGEVVLVNVMYVV